MATDFSENRAWANASKAIRHCQIADKAMQDGCRTSASDHYVQALQYFSLAREHLARSRTVTERRAGKLLESGNEQLRKALGEYMQGYAHSGRAHYEDALRQYDAALELID